jgi:lipopolysaccharide transport system ATP-binding protein
MNDIAIQVDNLSKTYQISHRGERSDTLRDFIVSSIKGIKSAVSNHPNSRETVWALKDICLEVKSGEILGVIGRNGAGKSTLLKILSRITLPTFGRAMVFGRVGSLLEVGAGFHPELSGRENIYLYGAILGMSRSEIKGRFDEMVAFAEIEKYLDTPVKRYSSGMYVRLAFAVAAHLEPEILLVDEVLAVGDSVFQKKCIGKMGDTAQSGRTVFFVSHNMGIIERLCSRVILLSEGQLVLEGSPREVIAGYLSEYSSVAKAEQWIDLTTLGRAGTGEARFRKLWLSSHNPKFDNQIYSNGLMDLVVLAESDEERFVSGISFTIYSDFGTVLINADTKSMGQHIHLKKGMNRIHFTVEKLHLSAGVYQLGLWMGNVPGNDFDLFRSGVSLEVISPETTGYGMTTDGAVACNFRCEIE